MSLWQELARRNVFRVGAAYLVVAWVITQVVDVLGDPLRLPVWFDTVVVVFLAAGFPVALILAWAFEITPSGIRHVPQEAGQRRGKVVSGQRLNYFVTTCLAIVVVLLVVDVYMLGDSPGEYGSRDAAVLHGSIVAPVRDSAFAMQTDSVEPAIVILPFEDLSPDPRDQVFASSLHSEFIDAVASLDGVRVIGAQTARSYAEDSRPVTDIAAELGVSRLLAGSVSFAGERIAVSMRLISAVTGETLWHGRFDRRFAEAFAIGTEVAREVANDLQVQWRPDAKARIARPRSESPAAYELYLRALASFDAGFPLEALELLNRALAVDPHMAAAFARKAEHYALSTVSAPGQAAEPGSSAQELALQNAERALELDDAVGPAWHARGIVNFRRGRWTAALSQLDRARKLGAVDLGALAGLVLVASGDAAAATQYAERNYRQNPRDGWAVYWFGYVLARAGRLHDALDVLNDAIELRPANARFHAERAAVLIELGDDAAAAQALRAAAELQSEPRCLSCTAWMAWLFARANEPDDAERLIREYAAGADPRAVGVADEIWLSLAAGDHESALAGAAAVIERIESGHLLHRSDSLLSFLHGYPSSASLEQAQFASVRRRLLSSFAD